MREAEDIPNGDTVAESGQHADSAPALVTRPLVGQAEGDYTTRFRIAFVALGVILVAAVAAVVVLLVKPGSQNTAAGWSEWRPAGGSDVEQAQSIADYVSVNYRLGDGTQLVTAQAEAPEVQSIPIDFIAIKSTPDGTAYSSAAIPIFRDANSKGVQYLLCGLGEACSIPEGTPSIARQRLLRREALELALYTFRYIDGRDYVVVFMPPKPGDRPTYALFFDRQDFKQQLGIPLRQTLPDPLELSPGNISPIETGVIDRLTNPRMFAFSYSQLQNQQVVLVLADWHGVTPQPIQSTASSSSGSTTGSTATTSTTTAPATTTASTSSGS